MFISTKAAGRKSVHWLIPALVVCIAIPALISMQACKKAEKPAPAGAAGAPMAVVQTARVSTHAIGLYAWKDKTGQDLVCPAPTSIETHRGDTVVFENLTGIDVTVKPTQTVFLTTGTFKVSAQGKASMTIDPNLKNCPITLTLDITITNGPTAQGCPGLPPTQNGPGMQVNQ